MRRIGPLERRAPVCQLRTLCFDPLEIPLYLAGTGAEGEVGCMGVGRERIVRCTKFYLGLNAWVSFYVIFMFFLYTHNIDY
jgi:hypothetical protein